MARFLLCPNLGWIQGQFNFTELSLRYPLLALEMKSKEERVLESGMRLTAFLMEKRLDNLGMSFQPSLDPAVI